MLVQNGIVRIIFKVKIYTIKILATVSINSYPTFKAFFKFVNVNFITEEMVWQIVPVFDDSHKEGVLKGVNFSLFRLYSIWMVGSSACTSAILEIVINVYAI